MNRVQNIFIMLMLITASVGVVSASIIDNSINWIKEVVSNIIPLSWFMPTQYVKVTDTSIEYYVGVSGNCWKTFLKDSSGNVINTQSGCSYGTQTFPRPTVEGTYNICILPDYKPSSYVECEPVYVPAKIISIPTLTPSPTLTQPTTSPTTTLIGCGSGEYKLNDKCIRVNPLPGFQIAFAIAGILAVFYLRRKI